MIDLNTLPYADWLEQSLKSIVDKPVQAICIMTKFESGDVGMGYFNCAIGDKMLFAGFIQQDAMIDTLMANGYLEDDEEDLEGDG